jgi:hypothetical protein
LKHVFVGVVVIVVVVVVVDVVVAKVVMQLPNTAEEGKPHFFEGVYEATKGDAKGDDCIAIFDPSSGTFTLERLGGVINNLKYASVLTTVPTVSLSCPLLILRPPTLTPDPPPSFAPCFPQFWPQSVSEWGAHAGTRLRWRCERHSGNN